MLVRLIVVDGEDVRELEGEAIVFGLVVKDDGVNQIVKAGVLGEISPMGIVMVERSVHDVVSRFLGGERGEA